MLLSVDNLTKAFGSRILFSGVSFQIQEKDSIGLIGTNGTGKTTLFRILTGEDLDFKGLISKSSSLRLGYMQQHVAKSEEITALQQVESVFADLISLETRLHDIELQMAENSSEKLLETYLVLRERFERDGGLTYHSRSYAALKGLGFSEAEIHFPLSKLSGGQKSKVSLARLLISDANLLLLDEPTNHLDLQAIHWLEEYLMSFRGAFIVVSHDRYFLDRVTKKTFEIEHQKIRSYSGGYTEFKQKKQEALEAQKKHYQESMKEVHRIEKIIDQQRQWSQERNFITIAHKQKSIDRLMDGLEIPETEEKTVTFSFTPKEVGGNEVLTVCELCARFDHHVLYQNVNLELKRGEHAFLLGANGCGKTTLLKSICNIYDMPGNIRLGYGVSIGYFDQTQDDLHSEKTVLSEIWDSYPSMTETQVRTALGSFLFRGDDVFREVGSLSGGERARLSLLRLMLSGANLLLLDEPTNHLDIASKEALEAALSTYQGTMLIVSHDRYFINQLADKVYHLDSSGLQCFKGNYEWYLEKSLSDIQNIESKQQKKQSDAAAQYRLRKQRESEYRKTQKNIQRLEQEIDQTADRIQELEDALTQEQVITDYQKIIELTAEIEKMQNKNELLMSEWEQANYRFQELSES